MDLGGLKEQIELMIEEFTDITWIYEEEFVHSAELVGVPSKRDGEENEMRVALYNTHWKYSIFCYKQKDAKTKFGFVWKFQIFEKTIALEIKNSLIMYHTRVETGIDNPRKDVTLACMFFENMYGFTSFYLINESLRKLVIAILHFVEKEGSINEQSEWYNYLSQFDVSENIKANELQAILRGIAIRFFDNSSFADSAVSKMRDEMTIMEKAIGEGKFE